MFAATLLVAGTAFFAACSSDDDGPKSYPVNVKVSLPSGLSASDVSNLKLVYSSDKGKTDTIDMTSETTSFVAVQGVYTFYVTGKVKNEANGYVSGTTTANVYSEASVTVPTSKIQSSTLIFKTIFNAGTKMGYVKDTYFEIVNNSDEVQYLDGVILLHNGANQKQANAWQANGYTSVYPTGQGAVVAFPGSGHDYPLQPGQSVLIANDAVNHAELSGAENAPDLSKADWEIYLDYNSREVDYPAPNLDVLFTNNKYMAAWGLGFFAGAFMLARLPEGVTPEAFAAYSANFMTTPGTTSTMLSMIMPAAYILDAVEIYDRDATEHYNYFLPADDAKGVTGCDIYSGKCVRRKVTKVVNGRAYYQDTNNSANDFLTEQPLTPGVTPSTAD